MTTSGPDEPPVGAGRSGLRHPGPRRVGMVLHPGFKLLEATGPLSVLHHANEHLRAAGQGVGYEVALLAPQAGPVVSDAGVPLMAQALPARDVPDTVFIAGSAEIEAALVRETGLIGWCAAHGPRSARFAALCTGSFFLAAAGLLDGRRAATHWNHAPRLGQLFPAVEVDADAIFVQSDHLWTSAGVTAAIDLALAFVERDHGRDIALKVARDMVMYLKRPGGQSQFSTLLTGQISGELSGRFSGQPSGGAAGGADLAELRAWAGRHLDQALTLGAMARRAGMSVRSFTRAFAAETGTSPMAWLEGLRCERARMLLLDTDLPLKVVAFRAGLRSDEQMRKVFRRRFSLSPREYRERFSGTCAG